MSYPPQPLPPCPSCGSTHVVALSPIHPSFPPTRAWEGECLCRTCKAVWFLPTPGSEAPPDSQVPPFSGTPARDRWACVEVHQSEVHDGGL